MATSPYLAMTAAEYHGVPSLPSRVAWMACHFSPYGLGISNIPDQLPEDSLLILSDVIPIHGHDPQIIAGQLKTCIDALVCRALLLDFQRTPSPPTQELADCLIRSIPCPVVVSQPFADGRNCPVFLPPCPPYIPLSEHVAPWEGREVWLELSYSHTNILLTSDGTEITTSTDTIPTGSGLADPNLHCHYLTHVQPEQVAFQLWRTDDDLKMLMEKSRALGIQHHVGLYQELISSPRQSSPDGSVWA